MAARAIRSTVAPVAAVISLLPSVAEQGIGGSNPSRPTNDTHAHGEVRSRLTGRSSLG